MSLEKATMVTIFTPSKLLGLLFCAAFLWQGCNIINPHEPIPTYIHIDSFSFQQSPGLTVLRYDNSPSGQLPTLSHEINTVWVYYNGSRVGIFDLPATFPVVASGSGQLQIVPAVAINGQNNNVAQYPFYSPDTSTLIAQPGKIINYTPKTKFYRDVTVKLIDYFDESNNTPNFAQSGGNRSLRIMSDNAESYDGSKFGQIDLLAVGDSSVDSSRNIFTIPSGVAFIEFTYKTTIPFYVGLQANLSSVISSAPYYLSGISPTTSWKKFYLQVDGFTANAQGDSYNFYIKAVLADAQSSGKLLIDNIQLVTF